MLCARWAQAPAAEARVVRRPKELALSQSRRWASLSVPERWLLGTAIAWCALLVSYDVFGLELASWRAQSVLYLLFCLVPIAMVVLTFRVRRGAPRVIAVTVAVLLAVLGLLPATCAGLELTYLGYPANPFFEPIGRLPFLRGELVLYRTDCGAPCTFGLVLRQERQVLPGIREARDLASWSDADTATMTLLSPGLVRVELIAFRTAPGRAKLTDVPLRQSLIWP